MKKTISEEMIEHLVEERQAKKRRGISRYPRSISKNATSNDLEMDPIAAIILAVFARKRNSNASG